MYGKIFTSIYDGTLVEDWRALITFQQFIVLADADGMVDITPEAIARRTGIPIEHINAGISILQKTDTRSRTQGDDGRRIELIDDHRDWGWHVVNHKIYRDLVTSSEIRAQTRERVRKHRERKKSENVTDVTDVTKCNKMKRYTDTNTNTNTKHQNTSVSVDDKSQQKVPKIPYQKILDQFHDILPMLPKTEKLTEKRRGYIKRLWVEDSLPGLENWKNFFNYIQQSDFLMGKTQSSGDRRPFKATLEWVTKPENYIKILEGNYHHE